MAVAVGPNARRTDAASLDMRKGLWSRAKHFWAVIAAYIWWGLETSEEEELVQGWSGR